MWVWSQHEQGEGLSLASREKAGHGDASRQSWSRERSSNSKLSSYRLYTLWTRVLCLGSSWNEGPSSSQFTEFFEHYHQYCGSTCIPSVFEIPEDWNTIHTHTQDSIRSLETSIYLTLTLPINNKQLPSSWQRQHNQGVWSFVFPPFTCCVETWWNFFPLIFFSRILVIPVKTSMNPHFRVDTSTECVFVGLGDRLQHCLFCVLCFLVISWSGSPLGPLERTSRW